MAEVEPDGAVAVVDGLEGVEVDAWGGDVLVVELVGIVLAETVADVGLVDLPVVEVEVEDTVATILGVQGVVVNARCVDVLTEIGVGVVLADGLVDVMFYVGVHMYGDTDIDVGETVGDMAGIGGVAESWGGNGVLRGGAVERACR